MLGPFVPTCLRQGWGSALVTGALWLQHCGRVEPQLLAPASELAHLCPQVRWGAQQWRLPVLPSRGSISIISHPFGEYSQILNDFPSRTVSTLFKLLLFC